MKKYVVSLQCLVIEAEDRQDAFIKAQEMFETPKFGENVLIEDIEEL